MKDEKEWALVLVEHRSALLVFMFPEQFTLNVFAY
jgi:hypothetical protein